MSDGHPIGIRIDSAFEVIGKQRSASEVMFMIGKAVPPWLFKSMRVHGDRIILKDVPSVPRGEDPMWKEVYQAMRTASEAGEWRLMSGNVLSRADSNEIHLDARGDKPQRRGSELVPHIESADKDMVGWTGASEALGGMIRDMEVTKAKAADLTVSPDSDLWNNHHGDVQGREGVVAIGTRITNEKGEVEPQQFWQIGLTIVHELAAHAGKASAAGRYPDASPDWGHHAVRDLDGRGGPSDAIQDFLEQQRPLIAARNPVAQRSSPFPPANLEPHAPLFETPARDGARGTLTPPLRAPNISPPFGTGVPRTLTPPAFRTPGFNQSNQLLQQQLQMRRQQGAMLRDQVQQGLQRAAQDRLRQDQQRQLQNQMRQAQDQRMRDSAQQASQRQADQQRQAMARAQRAADDMRRQQQQDQARRQEQMTRTMRAAQMPSRPPIDSNAAFRKPFVSPKLWQNPQKPSAPFTTMRLAPHIYTAPKPPPPPPISRPPMPGPSIPFHRQPIA